MGKESINQKKKILSLNGGGVRGLFTITILAQIEQVLADRAGNDDLCIGDYFDLITGASIGGILALALAKGKSARELKAILLESSPKIFPESKLLSLPFVGGLFKQYRTLTRTKYHPGPLKKAVIDSVGKDTTIRELERRVIIPTVNISTGMPNFIKTKHKPEWYRDDKFKLYDVALATSAAPTFFPPHFFNDSYFIDGGLVANNPALIAYHEAEHFLGWDMDSVYILNVGTLLNGFTIDHKTIEKGKGGYFKLWKMGEDLIEAILSSNQGMHGFMAKQALGEERWLSLDDKITPKQGDSITLDNSSSTSLEMLMSRANAVADTAIGQGTMMDDYFSETAEKFIHPDNNNVEGKL